MVKRTKIKCPYRYPHTKRCTHKEAGDRVFNNPLDCPIYQKWLDSALKQIKDDSYTVESPEE